MMKRSLLFLLCALITLIACAKKQIPEDVLIRVGDKYITVKDYQYRSEFSPRPNFPRHDRNLEKVTLNNLILEKLFVIENGDQSELKKNPNFQDFVKGIKEQKMREQLFYKKAYDVVKLDSAEMAKRYVLSQREYDLEFYTIRNDSIANAVLRQREEEPDSSVKIFDNLWGLEKRPAWTAKWKDPDHINIHEALYSGPLAQDSVIGPVRLEIGEWIMMKVVNWRDVLIFGGEEQQIRINEVKEKMTLNQATRNWHKYMHDVMKGKDIEFNKDTFLKLASVTYNLETAQDKTEKQNVIAKFWQEEDSTLSIVDLPIEEAFLQLPFFTIDNVTWTVGDFRKALASHPLVYRRAANNRGEFYNQFRIAVADLVRDYYLNKEAYKMGLDKDIKVERTAEMWEDAMVATFERDMALKRIGSTLPDTTDPLRQQKLQKAFDAYLAELRQKYHDDIEVNYEEFNKLKITEGNMIVMQNQVPYPFAVPSWPMFDNDNTVDYKELKKE